MANYFVDLVGGNDSNDGTTFANRKKTLASVTAATAGDTIRIMKSPDRYSLSQNATFTNKSLTVTLTSALTANISLCETAWTAATNVTATTTTTRKEGSNAASLAIGGSFTTGKIAYTSTATGNYSAYQQISFSIRANATVASGVLRIDLCSDTTGDTPVDSLTLNTNMLANSWHWFTLDKGSALGASIQSVALTALSDPGTVTVIIDNIIACKSTASSDVLTLNHLIGKNTDELWAIRAIDGTTVTLETANSSSAGTGRGYSGVTETVTAYARLPIASTPSTTAIQAYAGAAGTSGSHVTISGGWNTTDMTTQDSNADTLIDGMCDLGIGWNDANNRNWIDWSRVGVVRGSTVAGATTGTDITWTDIKHIAGVQFYSSSNLPARWTFTNVKVLGPTATFLNIASANGSGLQIYDCIVRSTANSTIAGFQVSNTSTVQVPPVIDGLTVTNGAATSVPSCTIIGPVGLVKDIVTEDNAGIGLLSPVVAYNVTSRNNSTFGVGGTVSSYQFGSGSRIYGLTTSGNTTAAFSMGTGANIVCYDANIAEGTVASGVATEYLLSLHRSTAYGNNTKYHPLGIIDMQTSVVPTSMTYAWRYRANNASGTSTYLALGKDIPIARVACKTSTNNTFQFACRRTNTNLTCNLRVYGGRYPGVTSDIVTSVNPSIDTWQNFSITINPSENCVVEIFFDCYHNGTTSYSAYIGGPVVVT